MLWTDGGQGRPSGAKPEEARRTPGGFERPPLEVGRQWMGGHTDSNTEHLRCRDWCTPAEAAVWSPQVRTI